MSLFGMANNAAIAVYPIVGAVIGSIIGWQATFGLTALLGLVAAVFLIPVVAHVDVPKSNLPKAEPAEASVMVGRPRLAAIAATNVSVVAAMIHRHGFRNTVLPLYAATVLGLGGLSIATAIALMAVCGLLVGIPGGMMGDRVGRRRLIVVGLATLAIGDLLFLLTHDLLSFLVAAAVVGLGDFFGSSQTALLSEIVPPESRTRVLSGYRFSVDIGAFIGPLLLASVMDAVGPQAAIVVAVSVLLAGSLVVRAGVPGRAQDALAHPTAT
jgi:MFS family permease